jgi:hypothetical protein
LLGLRHQEEHFMDDNWTGKKSWFISRKYTTICSEELCRFLFEGKSVLETKVRRQISRESRIMQSITDGNDLPKKKTSSGDKAFMEE